MVSRIHCSPVVGRVVLSLMAFVVASVLFVVPKEFYTGLFVVTDADQHWFTFACYEYAVLFVYCDSFLCEN